MKSHPGLSDSTSRMNSTRDHDGVHNLPQSPGHPKITGSIRLTFINDKEDIRWLNARNAARLRLQIFTDAERQEMSGQVVSSLDKQTPSRLLEELDNYDLDDGDLEPFSQFRGPFGASRWSRPAQHALPDTNPPEEFDQQLQQVPTDENNELSIWPLDILETDLYDNILPESEILLPDDIELYNPEPMILPEPVPFPIGGHIEGWTLLSHYKERIVPLISPLRRGQETPWISLVIPCAVTTLSELSLNGPVNNARLALLNAVWSTSAFHLGNYSAGCFEQWKISGEQYLKRAQYHFQQCMQESCLSTSKSSKYKEVLMAILSLSNAFMIKGDPDQRRSWLVQTEKFICIKGLSKSSLSAKKRALHHCYAYMRIMAETTCIVKNLNVDMMDPSEMPPDNSPSLYGGEFRVSPNHEFSTAAMLMEKDPEIGQRDLHLAIPGSWRSTLFPTVYGVDEIFLLLLSQVIRLANERDLSMISTNIAESNLSLKEFWSRAKALERAIDHLAPTYASHTPTTENLKTITATAQAMYTALLIFFHRRIYEIDPRMLQGKVDEMRICLMRVKEEEGYQEDSDNAALIWPAFIAACEAVTPELQLYFGSWFDFCARTTALIHASVAKQISETIWRRRDDVSGQGETCSWPDILRDGSIRFTCV